MSRLNSFTSSHSVSFRHGNNVEINSPNLQPSAGTVESGVVSPMDGYNLQQINNKQRNFSNPMYDAVQSSGSISLGNGAGKLILFGYIICGLEIRERNSNEITFYPNKLS